MSPSVLVLGLCRTGTQSMADALNILGYPNVYHMREVGKNDHQLIWADLINRKAAGHGPDLTKDDFEPVLGGWDGCADFPAAIFGLELIRIYPTAKVIITDRSEDSWVSSTRRTVGHPDAVRSGSEALLPLREAYHSLCWNNDFETNGRTYWREYNQAIRAAVPPERLLVHTLGEGWEQLCPFLGKDVPDVEWPNHDDVRKWKKT